MNMKIIGKIMYIFIIILSLTFLLNINVSLSKSISDEISEFEVEDTVPASVSGLQNVVQKILVALRVSSVLLLIIVVATSGIRYITASANLKGEIKKTAFPVIVGLIFLFGASWFAGYLIQFFE